MKTYYAHKFFRIQPYIFMKDSLAMDDIIAFQKPIMLDVGGKQRSRVYNPKFFHLPKVEISI